MEPLARAHDTIKAALEIFDQAHQSSQPVPSRATLQQAAERLKGETAKVAIMYTTGGSVGPAEAESIMEAFQNTVLAFCSCCHALTSGAGDSLRKEVKKGVTAAVRPCLGLVKALDAANPDDVKRQVALIWEGCDAIARWPLDNKSCLFRALTGVLAVVQDTQREMTELQQQQQGAGNGLEPLANGTSSSSSNGLSAAAPAATTAAAGEDAAMADLDFEPEALSQQEVAVLNAVAMLLDTAAGVLKSYSRCLLEGPVLASMDNQEGLELWESCCFHARHVIRSVEDLGASMYPPQDPEEVQDLGTSVADVLELMLDECPAPDALGQQLSQLQQQLTAARQLFEAAVPGLEGSS